MSKNATPLSRPIVMTGFATTVIIAAGAFILSFSALTDLAVMSGLNPDLAWIWPIIVDGLIVAATVAIVALAGHEKRVLAYPWALLFFGAVVSTAANAVHAILAVGGDGAVPAVVSAIVAAMPPVVLLAITHLTVILVQKSAAKPVKKPAAARRSTARKPAESVEVPRSPAPAKPPVERAAETPAHAPALSIA
ncbi:DUF2637 domain-containing protein [Arthrobacter sp. zg-Y1110]|uniref:DUF2637 domain-containing protein n=1 Tax=Arthrobacter sp. zg-Y1110 TaxID=2886932 RepID=UPI0021AF689F|nr:DUF2637 domain-containing protein [Arthrobacter sp. zg-Y1110]UWX87127.1 DUF2637 domain-containing protein [Arthrobacter sp. zg-Y1110]